MHKFFNISEASSIAIHGMVLLARADKPMNVKQIADVIGSSKHHVAKVFQRLVKFKFIRSMRGPTGGFYMDDKPEQVTLLQIYEAIDGEIEIPEDCPFGKDVCPFDQCIFSNFIQKSMIDFKAYLAGRTLDQFLDGNQLPDLPLK